MKYRSVGKCISVVHKNLNYYLNKKFEKYNVNMEQIPIIHHLNSHEGISQNELGKDILDDKITVTKRLRSLEDEGYIERRISEEDRRIKRLYLTEKGKELNKISREILDDMSEVLLENVSEEQEKIVKETLIQMAENMFNKVNGMRNN